MLKVAFNNLFVLTAGLVLAITLGAQCAFSEESEEKKSATSEPFVYDWPQAEETAPGPDVKEPEKRLYAKSFYNKKAPQFVAEQFLSKPLTAEDLQGKMVLIDFWATWCGPCRRAIPELNVYHHKFKDDLVVIGLSKEKPETVEAMTEPKIEYPSAIDTQGRMTKEVQVKGIPHVMIIDPQGYVRWQGFPGQSGHELTEQVIDNLISTYVKK